MIQVGVRLAKAQLRRIRRPTVQFGSVEATAITTDGVIELIRVAPERHNSGRGHVGPQYRFAVEVEHERAGFVTALLDHGTASAVVLLAVDGVDSDVVRSEAVSAALNSLEKSNPWLRRASIALHPEDTVLSRSLRLRGFDCEGEVPGYLEDEPGTRRQLWTIMLG